MGITPEITKTQKSFLTALRMLITYADAGYGVGLTFDGHTGVIVDIGSDCQVVAKELTELEAKGLSKSDAWLRLATKGINEVLGKSAKDVTMYKGGS